MLTARSGVSGTGCCRYRTVQFANTGRGVVAACDMKARIAALKRQGVSMDQIIDVLWERSHRAEVHGHGYTYEYMPDPLRPDPVEESCRAAGPQEREGP